MADAQDFIDTLQGLGCDADYYSGRGMYGKRCVSVSLDGGADLWNLAIALGEQAREVGPPTTDSLGMGIVAYWPHMKWPGEETV